VLITWRSMERMKDGACACPGLYGGFKRAPSIFPLEPRLLKGYHVFNSPILNQLIIKHHHQRSIYISSYFCISLARILYTHVAASNPIQLLNPIFPLTCLSAG
jgi:hypothetical protein